MLCPKQMMGADLGVKTLPPNQDLMWDFPLYATKIPSPNLSVNIIVQC